MVIRAETCGFFGSSASTRVGQKLVARSVGTVELGLIVLRKAADQGAHAVRIGERERLMPGERLDAVERRGFGNRGLQRQPFVDDQRIARIAAVEIVERGLALRYRVERQRRSAAIRSVMLPAW